MERKYSNKEKALAVAKEAMWLAWNESGGPSGYGVFRNKPGAEKEQVWDQAYNMGDYSGRGSMEEARVNADYVFGRMLKLRFRIEGNTLIVPDHEPHPAYQGWSGRKYKSYSALFDAAEKNVRAEKESKAA